MKKFFGTDGIRGIANRDLTPELAFRVGRIAAGVLEKSTPKIVTGKDPRLSSDMLEAAVISGALSAGAEIISCGIVPTPAVSHLTRVYEADAGIMISASHNPVEHNGIKIFAEKGWKLSDDQEKKIETHLKTKKDAFSRPSGKSLHPVRFPKNAVEEYQSYLKSHSTRPLAGLRLVLDCAYGATAAAAPLLFESLGAKVSPHGVPADGEKINVECGATDLGFLQAKVVEERADLGIAFDGDGDRAILVDAQGKIFNGDHILITLASHWKKKGILRGPVVTTVMANYGLEKALSAMEIPMVRTAVGDRFVLEQMGKLNASLGGEQSGHIILSDHAATGDGCLTALHILNVLMETGQTLSELGSLIEECPQLLVNVPVGNKSLLSKDAEIKKAIREEKSKLKGRGRIVVRPSGTEPLVRVMAEGPDPRELEEVVGRVAKTIELRLA